MNTQQLSVAVIGVSDAMHFIVASVESEKEKA